MGTLQGSMRSLWRQSSENNKTMTRLRLTEDSTRSLFNEVATRTAEQFGGAGHDGGSEVGDVSPLSNPRRRSIARWCQCRVVCSARQYRLVRIGRPSVRSSPARHGTRIRFFNLANALRGEIATRRRRRAA